jgi:hypothetical protein
MRTHSATERDRNLARVKRITRTTGILAAVVTAAFAGLAATHRASGSQGSSSAGSGSPSVASSTSSSSQSSGDDSLVAPSLSNQPTVVSGGS